MSLSDLRDVLREPVVGLFSRLTHKLIPGTCACLGMPEPSPEPASRHERMQASFDAVPDVDLPRVAERYILHFQPDPSLRNRVQEVAWTVAPGPSIPKRYRHAVAKALSTGDLYDNCARFDELLTRLWVVDLEGLDAVVGQGKSLRAEIDRHVYRNPGDWTVSELFERLGAFDCTDRRFALFVAGLASSDVRPDEEQQRRFVATVNGALRGSGVELAETGLDGGYPSFTLVSRHTGTAGRPKNLIFASSVKPDLRFSDAVNNDVEVVTGADKVLIYDRPIGADGLLWRELQAWWSEQEGEPDPIKAKASLYRRLAASLPENSPPQENLFVHFFKSFGAEVPNLPALLPEVWLHWDPKTVAQRGANALTRFRMDFLLLLPENRRIVVEVDGQQHYAEDGGHASPTKYGEMMAADRDLRLAGYEVFRFGGAELGAKDAPSTVAAFFRALFKRYGVTARRTF